MAEQAGFGLDMRPGPPLLPEEGVRQAAAGFLAAGPSPLAQLESMLGELQASQARLMQVLHHEQTSFAAGPERGMEPLQYTFGKLPQYEKKVRAMARQMEAIQARVDRLRARQVRLQNTVASEAARATGDQQRQRDAMLAAQQAQKAQDQGRPAAVAAVPKGTGPGTKPMKDKLVLLVEKKPDRTDERPDKARKPLDSKHANDKKAGNKLMLNEGLL